MMRLNRAPEKVIKTTLWRARKRALNREHTGKHVGKNASKKASKQESTLGAFSWIYVLWSLLFAIKQL